MNFSYDAEKIADRGLNQMRFELGDVFVEEPEKSAYLPDEEISAAIESSRSFKRAKLKLLETLLRRFSYEVDTQVAEMKLSLNQRVDFWEREFKRLKAEVDAEEISDGGALKVFGRGRPPIFRVGMNDWRPLCI